MADCPLVLGVDAYNVWQGTLLTDAPPSGWKIGDAFDHVEVGPGQILLLGGAPGSGTTALLLQWIFEALFLNPLLRILIANVEMSPSRLLDRQLARLSGVPLTLIRRHAVTSPGDLKQISVGLTKIQKVVNRIAFVRGPYTLDRIAGAVDDSGADLIVLDYIQRIELTGKFNGMRDKANALMSKLREFADGGYGVIAAAALTRSKDSKGRSSYDGKHLGLASFRESSELEYGADDAFLLYPTDQAASLDDPERPTTLAHVKFRDGETQTIELIFHRRTQSFEPNAWAGTAATSVRFAVPSPNGKGHK
jgi:replicative DNA helicase